ncbi:hypothetical protein EHQ47_18095 [Leptospira bourretii]|uniref:hypothetical protein n=1 Tax=Leptospira bourretii TaxID=2484962 RepID=UPI001090D5C5|nr:hypothetical protein [Leptospira bourretii]TGL18440.1 hypothetical protein EHQ47_18095 [Leptospira bourretii]
MNFFKIIALVFLVSFFSQCITYLKNDYPAYNPAKIDKKIANVDFILYYNHYNAFNERSEVSYAVHQANKQAFTNIIAGCNCINRFTVFVDGLDDISKIKSKNLVKIEVTSRVQSNVSLYLTSTLFVLSGTMFPVFGEISGKTEFVAFNQGKEIKRYTYENDVIEVRQGLLLFVMPFRRLNYITNQNVPDNFVNDIYRDKLYPTE